MTRWAGKHGEDLALRVYTARLIGDDPSLVLHGGGNVSVKGTQRTVFGDDAEAIFVKGSGWDLATIEPDGLPGLLLPELRRLRSLDRLTDDLMVNEIRRQLFHVAAPTPSIETLVHAFLPHKFVDHSHADAVLAVTNHPDGEELARRVLGSRVAVLPYVRPGFDLAKAVADVYERNPRVEGIVLVRHGLFTFGEDARTSYERHIAVVNSCEEFVEERASRRPLSVGFRATESPDKPAAKVAPILRGLLSLQTQDEDRPYLRPILEWRASEELMRLVHSAEINDLCTGGPLTGDHLLHTKSRPALIELPTWSDKVALRRQLVETIETFRREQREYVTRCGGSTAGMDASPRVVILPGAGLFAWGSSKRDARRAADIAEHTLLTKAKALAIGPYQGLSEADLFDNEFRPQELAKLKAASSKLLDRTVVIISGGAGAIGSAVAESCIEAGGHVAITDLDESRIAQVVERLEQKHGLGTVFGAAMDVTDEGSVAEGYARVVRYYGGVDVLVANAGLAHVSAIDEMQVDDFRRVMEVNALGYLLFLREGIKILKQQGTGGSILINASKNVFAPGKDFAAYSASKAAAHQLGKVAAIELAPFGIRVNMINADGIFGDEQTPSGLWQAVGPQRAATHQLSPEELPEFYRQRNLLKARVHGYHVGRAVVFFASHATPTTGATLPIDGGIAEAFPR